MYSLHAKLIADESNLSELSEKSQKLESIKTNVAHRTQNSCILSCSVQVLGGEMMINTLFTNLVQHEAFSPLLSTFLTESFR